MMRLALAVLLGFGVVTLAGLSTSATAQEKKKDEKKTLEGTLTCTKCALGETKACGHALIVKEGDKKVTYYLADKGGKEPYHKECCTADVEGVKVTGKIVEKDKKKTIEDAEGRCSRSRFECWVHSKRHPRSGGVSICCRRAAAAVGSLTVWRRTMTAKARADDEDHPGQPARLLCRRQHGHREPGSSARRSSAPRSTSTTRSSTTGRSSSASASAASSSWTTSTRSPPAAPCSTAPTASRRSSAQHSTERNLRAIDATCPLVTKVHLEAVRFAREGYTIVLIGHEGHDEVIGTMGEAPASIVLVEDADDVEALTCPPMRSSPT